MQPNRLDALQFLRAFAATLVVVNHAIVADVQTGGDGLGLADFSGFVGRYAVEVFFVISGYIMVWTSLGRFGSPGYWRDFLVKRLTRIAPIYWVLSLVSLMKGLVAHHKYSAAYVAFSFLFVPYPDGTRQDTMSPVLGVGWSLNFEMLFYLVFAATAALRPRQSMLAIGAFFGALVAWGFVAGTPAGTTGQVASYLADPITLYFVAGMACAHIAAAVRGAGLNRLPYREATLLAVGITVVMSWYVYRSGRHDQIQWIQALPAVVVVLVCAAFRADAESRARTSVLYRFTQRLGDASYSLYLSHPIVVGLFAKALRLPTGLAIVANALLCIGVGLAVHRYVELPLLDWVRRRMALPRALAPSA